MKPNKNDRYLPLGTDFESEGFVLRRLKHDFEAASLFLRETTSVIGALYDEITPEFAKNLIEIDRQGEDPNGYFSLGKEVWVAREASTAEILGFEVITRKRGGSIKLGPTLVLPKAQGRHLAVRMINRLIHEYALVGARKVYVTAPLVKDALSIIDFRDLQLRLEAILKSQYREGSWERVAGRVLRPAPAGGITPQLSIAPNTVAGVHITTGIDPGAETVFQQFLLASMIDEYDDIDESFTRAVANAAERGFRAPYEKKGKIIFCVWSSGQLIGAAICSPKRGGAIKIAPLLIAPPYRSNGILTLLLDTIAGTFRAHEKRKLFLLVPISSWWLVSLSLQLPHFYIEGVLREPYKPAIDVAVISTFL
jgi:GNAT superfamily N-acetyltransferase